MGISTKSLAGSFSLNGLSHVNLGNVMSENYYADDYETINYQTTDDKGPTVVSFFSNIFGGNDDKTGATVGSISTDTSLPDDFLDALRDLGIPEKYYDDIAQLYNTIMENKTRFLSYDYQHEIIKEWIKTSDIPVAEILNEIIKNKTGLDIQLTDEFVEKYGDSIIDNILNIKVDVIGAILGGSTDISIELMDIINDLQSSNVRKVGHAIYELFTIIDELNIPYDEIIKVFPDLANYLSSIINIDGLVINDQTLKALWDALTFYKDKADQGDFNILDPKWYENNTSAVDIAKALRDIYPSFFELIDLIGGEDVTNYILRKIINKMPDILDSFMDLVDSFQNAKVTDYPGLLIEIIEFLDDYNIDIWEIIGGIGGKMIDSLWNYVSSGEIIDDIVFPVRDTIVDAAEYVASGQILDDALEVAQDVGSTIAVGAVATWNYVSSGEIIEDVGSIIDEVGSWSLWIWNW